MVMSKGVMLLVVLLASLPGIGDSPGDWNAAEFLVGEWRGDFTLYPSPRVAKEVSTPARLTTVWGPGKAWIESLTQMELPGAGLYAVRVLLRFDRKKDCWEALVVNNFGWAVYEGRAEANRLEFMGSVGSVMQKVTYENLDAAHMVFTAVESEDGGKTWRPHSRALLTRWVEPDSETARPRHSSGLMGGLRRGLYWIRAWAGVAVATLPGLDELVEDVANTLNVFCDRLTGQARAEQGVLAGPTRR